MCVCVVCVCVRESVCMYVCVRECVYVCVLCVRERCPHSTAYTVLPILHSTELFILHTYLCVTYPLCNINCIPSCMHTPVISCVLVRISSSPLTVCMYVR